MDRPAIETMNIGIVGLGLIGGSIARALGKRAGVRFISAADTDGATLKKAWSDHTISCAAATLRELEDCDLIYLCVPAGSVFGILDELSRWYGGIVTDTASTKGNIVSYVRCHYPEMRFVGGHPMAGSEKVGYAASKSSLFENAPYIVCPMRTDSNQATCDHDIQIVRELASRMSAVPVEMDAAEHDTAVGLISHLPHIAAYSLVGMVDSSGDARLKAIAAGGFRDITRIASSDPALWADILCDSGDTIANLLEDYIDLLARMKTMLKARDRQALYETFSAAKAYRDQLPLIGGLSGRQAVQLWVEVDDKPGMIGKIALLFGDHGINIKNMNIQDNRAYEGGSLRITLSCAEDAKLGARLLESEKLAVRIVE